jgi:hypothetical protein
LPSEWKENKTVLLPKPGRDAARVENYRPITIGSLLGRIYWGIIDQRLRDNTAFSPRQKGFVNEAGCFNNLHIFNELLRKAKNTGVVAIQLDISNAFDTVPYRVIGPAHQTWNPRGCSCIHHGLLFRNVNYYILQGGGYQDDYYGGLNRGIPSHHMFLMLF